MTRRGLLAFLLRPFRRIPAKEVTIRRVSRTLWIVWYMTEEKNISLVQCSTVGQALQVARNILLRDVA